jgi:ribosomal-protein-alanine N-acetyltransferase
MGLTTPRLTLRSLTMDEWAAVAEGRSTNGIDDYPTEGDLVVAGLIVAGQWTAGEWGPLQVCRRGDGLAIGGVGCKGEPDADGRVEIGYGIAESARGCGYATEAVLGLLGWLREQDVREVIAECDEGNSASIAVLRGCGFVETSRDDGLVRWSLKLSRA